MGHTNDDGMDDYRAMVEDYDTLKAKAELFDELSVTLKCHWEHCSLEEAGCRVCKMHHKAKELKCTVQE